ncbi:MAG: hypothetical protein Q7S20_09270 [Gemmatimonadaceae bacterium]|nr:hypothetical protein [Gemmatimonadaceae bacterium]
MKSHETPAPGRLESASASTVKRSKVTTTKPPAKPDPMKGMPGMDHSKMNMGPKK